MADRFDLEQGIMQCWGITDDIDLLRDTVSNAGVVDADQVDNFLLGLKTIYDIKFEKLFETYSQLIKEQKI
jgi:hypothetical protein